MYIQFQEDRKYYSQRKLIWRTGIYLLLKETQKLKLVSTGYFQDESTEVPLMVCKLSELQILSMKFNRITHALWLYKLSTVSHRCISATKQLFTLRCRQSDMVKSSCSSSSLSHINKASAVSTVQLRDDSLVKETVCSTRRGYLHVIDLLR